jgi:glyoxylase-like metal-dependent hydrolase (beta-lactamase superfamily II)
MQANRHLRARWLCCDKVQPRLEHCSASERELKGVVERLSWTRMSWRAATTSFRIQQSAEQVIVGRKTSSLPVVAAGDLDKLQLVGGETVRMVIVPAVLSGMLIAGTTAAQDAARVVDETARAMGAATVDAVTYSGAAAIGNFGQSRNISFRLASTSIRNYTNTIDFTRSASYATGEAVPPQVPGASPEAPRPYEERLSAETDGWSRQLRIWITPWGFLRGASLHNPTLKTRKLDGVTYKVVSWVPPLKAPSGQPYKVVGYIGPGQTVDRVETWVEHPVMGDLHVEAFYSNYQQADSLKVPARMSIKEAGMETFLAVLNRVIVNPPDLDGRMALPAAAVTGSDPAGADRSSTPATSERLADGVYRIGGAYVAMAVEFQDFVVVLEGGQNEARGLAILAETKRLFPNKRVRYVVNTHPHFDHAGGLPPFVAEGITIITDDNNKYFLEAALGSPRTLVGDVLAKSHRKPKVEGVIDEMIIKDGRHALALYHVEKLEHSEGMLIAYLPQERILFTADFNAPGPGQPPSPSLTTLLENIERLHLDFDRHVLVHPPEPDRPMTKADLQALVKGSN